jgi:NAD(P)-dependent dehydrogenase (short-subunit alcohol dehydrogenase family)
MKPVTTNIMPTPVTSKVRPLVWFITGASRGLGARIAQAVLAHGNNLVATARNKNSIQYGADNPEVLPLSLDVTSEEQAKAAVQAVADRFGRIDVLVNNAGYGLLGGIEESSANEVEAIYRTNVFGTLNMIRAVLPIMRQQKAGHIINMSSLGGYQSSVGFGVYCSTKFAVEGITEALYGEVKPLGIHATVVEPGFFRTDFLDGSSLQRTKEEIEDYAPTVGKVRSFAGTHNHEQPGDPAKLAEALLRLVALPDPPLRLPLGPDALRRIAAKNSFVAEEIERWRTLSESTNLH